MHPLNEGGEMHELSIAESVIDAITSRTGERPVTRVRLEIGALSGVSADSLCFCFALATEGTPVHGATLDIEQPPGQAHCLTCDADFALPELILLCPCGSSNIQVLAGEELRILSVEMSR
jgi:hydrogenase nickel incorporation protein HypA/HybF